MIKMIMTAPIEFNAELFCDVAMTMVRESAGEDSCRNYDYKLGDYLQFAHEFGFCQINSKGERFYRYELDASLVDFAILKALKTLQTLCPQVEIFFENCGSGANVDYDYEETDPLVYIENFI